MLLLTLRSHGVSSGVVALAGQSDGVSGAIGTLTVTPAAGVGIFEAVRLAITGLARPAFFGEATGRPTVPYAVVNPDWEPEPDVGQELLGTPGAQRVGIQVNSYGRANVDALWLDTAIYALLMREGLTLVSVNVLFRDADDSPVLSRTDAGLILSKHWYRFVYS